MERFKDYAPQGSKLLVREIPVSLSAVAEDGTALIDTSDFRAPMALLEVVAAGPGYRNPFTGELHPHGITPETRIVAERIHLKPFDAMGVFDREEAKDYALLDASAVDLVRTNA